MCRRRTLNAAAFVEARTMYHAKLSTPQLHATFGGVASGAPRWPACSSWDLGTFVPCGVLEPVPVPTWPATTATATAPFRYNSSSSSAATQSSVAWRPYIWSAVYRLGTERSVLAGSCERKRSWNTKILPSPKMPSTSATKLLAPKPPQHSACSNEFRSELLVTTCE